MEIEKSSSYEMIWLTVTLLFAAVIVGIGARYYRQRQVEEAREARAPEKVDGPSFRRRTAALGFKLAETKMLKKAAAALTRSDPVTMLTTERGRERLIRNFEKRITRRESETEMLSAMVRKLENMRDPHQHDREGLRVEVDLRIWLIKRLKQVVTTVSEEEEELDNIQPVEGRLLDLSEGGAAVRTDLELAVGDLLRFWSVNSDTWLPPLTAGVVHMEEGKLDEPPILHLHFLDPPMSKLRSAIRELREQYDPETT